MWVGGHPFLVPKSKIVTLFEVLGRVGGQPARASRSKHWNSVSRRRVGGRGVSRPMSPDAKHKTSYEVSGEGSCQPTQVSCGTVVNLSEKYRG